MTIGSPTVHFRNPVFMIFVNVYLMEGTFKSLKINLNLFKSLKLHVYYQHAAIIGDYCSHSLIPYLNYYQ